MKKIQSFLAAFLLMSPLAQAADWPQRLLDLPAESVALITTQTQGLDLSGFTLNGIRNTVDDHAIVSYFAQGAPIVCTMGWREGEVDHDLHYVDLYVQSSRIKQVTSFTSYACPQD
jgi:hypothetical protein